eukprot:1158538-Pelagomonas_calceolata.AAC.2
MKSKVGHMSDESGGVLSALDFVAQGLVRAGRAPACHQWFQPVQASWFEAAQETHAVSRMQGLQNAGARGHPEETEATGERAGAQLAQRPACLPACACLVSFFLLVCILALSWNTAFEVEWPEAPRKSICSAQRWWSCCMLSSPGVVQDRAHCHLSFCPAAITFKESGKSAAHKVEKKYKFAEARRRNTWALK